MADVAETNNVGLQLYTVRSLTQRDMLQTLNDVAQIGYGAVEFAGYGGVPVAELRTTLDSLAMRAMGAHVPYAAFEADPDAVFADLHTLGCEYAIIPWLPPEMRGAEQMRGLAKTFNHWAALCRDEGLRFGYHNHNFEFEPATDGADGETIYDVLLAATDPGLVVFELDIYWAQHAGVDPIELLRRYGTRMPIVHVKDMHDDRQRSDAPVGLGILPWGPIIGACKDAGVSWYIVEQDNPQDPLADVGTSLRNLTEALQD